jgi:hypothetical protein
VCYETIQGSPHLTLSSEQDNGGIYGSALLNGWKKLFKMDIPYPQSIDKVCDVGRVILAKKLYIPFDHPILDRRGGPVFANLPMRFDQDL